MREQEAGFGDAQFQVIPFEPLHPTHLQSERGGVVRLEGEALDVDVDRRVHGVQEGPFRDVARRRHEDGQREAWAVEAGELMDGRCTQAPVVERLHLHAGAARIAQVQLLDDGVAEAEVAVAVAVLVLQDAADGEAHVLAASLGPRWPRTRSAIPGPPRRRRP